MNDQSVRYGWNEYAGRNIPMTVLYVIESMSGSRGPEVNGGEWTDTWAVVATTTDRDSVRELLTQAAFGDWDSMPAAIDDAWNRGQGIAPRRTRCRNVSVEIPLLEDAR